jgi:hypothetical protein
VVDQRGVRQMSDGDYALVLSDLVRQQSATIVTPAGRGTWQTVNPAHAPKVRDSSWPQALGNAMPQALGESLGTRALSRLYIKFFNH